MIRSLAREPMVHFVLAGALLFAAYGLAGSGQAAPTGRILVGPAEIADLAADWHRQWGRDPTREELDTLVQSHIREQILYREALELGLDRNDMIVRRRMLQKMEFLGEAAAVDEPQAGELERFFRAGAERYRLPARISFAHAYFSRDRRGAAVESDARAALGALRATSGAAGLGDPFLLGFDHRERTRQDVQGQFGALFARAVFALDAGDWQGPIESVYGFHLVRVERRSEGRLPSLEEIRPKVLADWREARRKEAGGDLYARLRVRYEVEVDERALAEASARE